NWTGWSFVDKEKFSGAPTVVCRTPSTRDVFLRDGNGAVRQKHWNGLGWEWIEVNGFIQGQVGALVEPGGGITLYARGGNDRLWENRSMDGRTWEGWKPQPGNETFASSPEVVATDRFTRDIFGIGFDQVVYQKHWNGASWELRTVGGLVQGEVAAVALAPGVIQLYARGMDDSVWQSDTNDGGMTWTWKGHTDGARIIEPPTTVVTGVSNGVLARDMYVIFPDQSVWQRWYG
ncbi:MAG TPA: hypothetical protein VFR37_24120, partial [Longimicrobium sp.]|nr:hypothetical protein [Longimicrobium sp.]